MYSLARENESNKQEGELETGKKQEIIYVPNKQKTENRKKQNIGYGRTDFETAQRRKEK